MQLGGIFRRHKLNNCKVKATVCSNSFSSPLSTSSSSSLIKCSPSPEDERVAVLQFNNPGSLNALSVQMGDDIDKAINGIDFTKTRVVIVTGVGRAFSAGGDLQFLRDRATCEVENNASIMRNFYSLFLTPFRVRIPVPTIAAVNGAAIGAGLCLALAMDLRIVAKSAKLGVSFTNLGLHPGMGSTHFLPLIVGHQQAARLLLTAEHISGAEAEKMGLALEAVEDDAVMSRALALASKIASQSPNAVRATTLSLRMNTSAGLERALQREADAQAVCYATKEYSEGLASIIEKRPPSFSLK